MWFSNTAWLSEGCSAASNLTLDIIKQAFIEVGTLHATFQSNYQSEEKLGCLVLGLL